MDVTMSKYIVFLITALYLFFSPANVLAESPVDKKGATLPAQKDRNAYELLTPRMKEKVRLKVLKDFAKHPEKYRIEDGTIHLR